MSQKWICTIGLLARLKIGKMLALAKMLHRDGATTFGISTFKIMTQRIMPLYINTDTEHDNTQHKNLKATLSNPLYGIKHTE